MMNTPEHTPTGIEALVCADIAKRQAHGVAKYGTTVADNPLTLLQWHQHHLEELYDAAVYTKKIIVDLEAQQRKLEASTGTFSDELTIRTSLLDFDRMASGILSAMTDDFGGLRHGSEGTIKQALLGLVQYLHCE